MTEVDLDLIAAALARNEIVERPPSWILERVKELKGEPLGDMLIDLVLRMWLGSDNIEDLKYNLQWVVNDVSGIIDELDNSPSAHELMELEMLHIY